MSKGLIERFFSLLNDIFYKQIGTKIRTDSLKFFWDYFFVIFEKTGNKFEVISKNYMKLYNDLVRKEIKMANISSEHKILIIGCGTLPATSALIALQTKAKIITIDNDKNAIKGAKYYFKKLNLEKNINVEYADGLNYPINKFDFIFLLHGVKQQKEILIYLAEKMADKTKIIFRTVCDNKGNISNKSINITKLFNIENSVNSDYLGSIDSLLLSKKIKKL